MLCVFSVLCFVCFQYYATVDPDNLFSDENIPWLSRENVEDRSGSGLTGLPEMVGSGQSVGSVVSSTVPASSEQVTLLLLLLVVVWCVCVLSLIHI